MPSGGELLTPRDEASLSITRGRRGMTAITCGRKKIKRNSWRTSALTCVFSFYIFSSGVRLYDMRKTTNDLCM